MARVSGWSVADLSVEEAATWRVKNSECVGDKGGDRLGRGQELGGGTREAFLEEGRSPALPCKMIPEMAAGLVGAFFLVASRAWGVFGNTMGFTSNRMGWALARLSPAHR